MAFESQPPGGRFVITRGPRGPRGPEGEQGPPGEPGQDVSPSHTHDIGDVDGLTATLAAKADLVEGKVPTSQIPALTLTRPPFTVNSEAAMVALDAEAGDLAIRTDTGETWVHNGGTAGTVADWTELPAPTAPVSSVNGQTGVVVLSAADIGAIGTTFVNAKGDLVTATTDDNPVRFGVGADRQVLEADADEATGLAWRYPTVAVSTVTADHPLVLDDIASVVRVNSSSNLTVTIPTNASVPFPIGAVVNVRRIGTGTVAIVAAGGVTLFPTGPFTITDRGDEVSLHKVDTNAWDIVGALSA
jgi:hypothetical protein